MILKPAVLTTTGATGTTRASVFRVFFDLPFSDFPDRYNLLFFVVFVVFVVVNCFF